MQLEAVYEQGVLRPVEPLSLPEHQRLMITITLADEEPTEALPYNPRIAEQEWLRLHSGEYIGQWVALDGDSLVSHGAKALDVLEEARRKGVERPLMVGIPKDYGLPSAGLLQILYIPYASTGVQQCPLVRCTKRGYRVTGLAEQRRQNGRPDRLHRYWCLPLPFH